jgi:protein O-GlcNAc transferase
MVDDYPENYALLMGCANILNNKGYFEEAVDLYTRVSDLKPKWTRPLEYLAYIYEYKRVLKSKSMEYANRLLEMDNDNRVALFVLGRNEKDIDTKIEKLKKVTELHPYYARAFNEIGIVYGGTKKEYENAITWYEKASEAAPMYASCYNNIGVNL